MDTCERRALLLVALLALAPASLGAAATPDPSEVMTPEELMTIPEPVPATTPALDVSGAGGAATAAPRAPGDPLWRVQVFATQDPAQADRVAREAGVLLGAKAYVAREASQYKVRLGDYGSEGEAAELKAKAVRSGYPGAFRIRCAPNPTLNND